MCCLFRYQSWNVDLGKNEVFSIFHESTITPLEYFAKDDCRHRYKNEDSLRKRVSPKGAVINFDIDVLDAQWIRAKLLKVTSGLFEATARIDTATCSYDSLFLF